jgi:hypothetical protein
MIGKVAVRVSGVVAMPFKPVPAKALPATTALAVILTTLGPSLAGGKAVECYEPYRTAPVYGTAQERVLFLRGVSERANSGPRSDAASSSAIDQSARVRSSVTKSSRTLVSTSVTLRRGSTP